MKALICFDLDETLIKSNRAHFFAFNKAFKKNNLKKISYRRLTKLLNGQHAHQIVKKLFPRISDKKVNKIVEDHHNFIKETAKHVKAIKGVKTTLKKLKKRFKLGLITNCSHKEIDAFLKSSKIGKRFFSIIIGKEDVKKTKPHPDAIFKAERLLKAKANYHIGDSIYDILAGKRAKIKTIAVLTGITSKKELERKKPDMILKSINELPKVI